MQKNFKKKFGSTPNKKVKEIRKSLKYGDNVKKIVHKKPL